MQIISVVECNLLSIFPILSLEGIILCSVDKFVQENMDMIEGMIIEASQDYINFVCDVDVTNNQETSVLTQDNQNDNESLEIGQDDVNTIDRDINNEEMNISSPAVSGCPACKNKDWPGEAHKCIVCGKNVHILPVVRYPLEILKDMGKNEFVHYVTANNKHNNRIWLMKYDTRKIGAGSLNVK